MRAQLMQSRQLETEHQVKEQDSSDQEIVEKKVTSTNT